MTCKQLGGTCDAEFRANTFEEMSTLSKNHSMEMYKKGCEDHIKKMNEMRKNDPGAMKEWFKSKKEEFDSMPED